VRRVKAVLVFFICGLTSGLCFGILLSARSLVTFWFVKGDKFLIPTYRYYLGAGIFLLLGLAAGYAILRMIGSLRENSSASRKVVSVVIVATSPVILFGAATAVQIQTATPQATDTGTILLINTDPATLYLGGVVGFVLLISISCWILTAKLYYFGVFLNFLALPAAVGLMYLVYKMDVPSKWSELFSYPAYFSLLSASCGFWIAKARRVDSPK